MIEVQPSPAQLTVPPSSLAMHPFLHGMSAVHLAALAPTARVVNFPAGCRLFEEGGNATRFWLIQSGRAALDLYVPGVRRIVIESIGMGELLGWSWLFPPYQWEFGAITASTLRAYELDANLVRSCCQADPQLGFDLTQRLLRVLAHRVRTTRTRLATLTSTQLAR